MLEIFLKYIGNLKDRGLTLHMATMFHLQHNQEEKFIIQSETEINKKNLSN